MQASRVGLDGLNKRLIKEMYDLANEQGPFCLDGLNNTHLDFAWNVGLEVRAQLMPMGFYPAD